MNKFFTACTLLLVTCSLTFVCPQQARAQAEDGSMYSQYMKGATLLRCFSEFTACPERKEYMIKQADYTECLAKSLKGTGGGGDCDRLRPLTDTAPNCPDDAARPHEVNVQINACLTSKGFEPTYHADETKAIRVSSKLIDSTPNSGASASTNSSAQPKTAEKSAGPVSADMKGDPFGLDLKKAVLGQLFDELTKKGMPNGDNPTDSSRVYVFFVARKNVTTYVTDLLAVQRYSDGTWPFTKDNKQRFASTVAIGLPNVALAGYFADSLTAYQAWKDYSDKVDAYGINRIPVAFEIEPDFSKTAVSLADRPGSTAQAVSHARVTKVINLPDITIAGKYRPSLGIMPIIDTETTLNQQFLIYQYLKDNPVILNGKDTIQASLTDYRAYTQFSLGGTMAGNSYSLKLWQKEKPLAELVIEFTEKTTLEERMTSIGRQLGRMLSGDTENYQVREKPRTKNLYDDVDIIQSEVHKGTEISTLFPNATTMYLPSGLELPSELSHLSGRVSNLPYLKHPSPNGMAQMIRGIYRQADEKQFFFTNGEIPYEMKVAIRKLTQPTSRRAGSALSYVAVGDAFLNIEHNLDGAACSYYSALLLAPNLAASHLEKATVKRMVYQRMKKVAEERKQTYLASLFALVADLNNSYLTSPAAQASHQEYYTGINNTASACQSAEKQAREIRSQKRGATLGALLVVAGGVAQAANGRSFSNAEINQLGSQVANLGESTKLMQSSFAESFKDLKYEQFEMRDESGDQVELNMLYLHLEVLWHLGLRNDKAVVGKQLLAYAADKPNLRVALEEYLSETDPNKQDANIGEFQNNFRYIEEQANRYESWGKKLPKKVMARF